jgi:hypothetical protein
MGTKTYYLGQKVVVADDLKVAHKTFEKICNRKVDKKEIFDYDPSFLSYYEKVDEGYLIPLKDGSYLVKLYWGERGYHVFSSFDKNKAKVFTGKKGVEYVEALIYYTSLNKRTTSIKIDVDGVIINPDVLI